LNRLHGPAEARGGQSAGVYARVRVRVRVCMCVCVCLYRGAALHLHSRRARAKAGRLPAPKTHYPALPCTCAIAVWLRFKGTRYTNSKEGGPQQRSPALGVSVGSGQRPVCQQHGPARGIHTHACQSVWRIHYTTAGQSNRPRPDQAPSAALKPRRQAAPVGGSRVYACVRVCVCADEHSCSLTTCGTDPAPRGRTAAAGSWRAAGSAQRLTSAGPGGAARRRGL
jgi:hypothetical protein